MWLVAWAVVPTLLLFLRFNFPELARIYLPVDVILVVLGRGGARPPLDRGPGPTRRRPRRRHAALAVVWCGLVTWSTLFVGPGAALHVPAVHHPLPEDAHPAGSFDDIAATLRATEITEPVAVAFVWGPLFRILTSASPLESSSGMPTPKASRRRASSSPLDAPWKLEGACAPRVGPMSSPLGTDTITSGPLRPAAAESAALWIRRR